MEDRESFQSRLEEEVERYCRYDTPLWLILLEPEDPEALAAKGESLVGDVMQQVGRFLDEHTRRVDVVGRLSDSRVAVALAGITEAQARAAAERWRQTLAGSSVIANGLDEPLAIAVKAGVASLEKQRHREAKRLIELAEQDLGSSRRD